MFSKIYHHLLKPKEGWYLSIRMSKSYLVICVNTTVKWRHLSVKLYKGFQGITNQLRFYLSGPELHLDVKIAGVLIWSPLQMLQHFQTKGAGGVQRQRQPCRRTKPAPVTMKWNGNNPKVCWLHCRASIFFCQICMARCLQRDSSYFMIRMGFDFDKLWYYSGPNYLSPTC